MRTLLIVLSLALVLSLSAAAFAGQDAPDLTGTWQGTMDKHTKAQGFVSGDTSLKLVVLEQKGRLFHGEKSWVLNGKPMKEAFSGVITPKGDIYLAEDDDGVSIGEYEGGTITFYYVETGPNRMAVLQTLTRK